MENYGKPCSSKIESLLREIPNILLPSEMAKCDSRCNEIFIQTAGLAKRWNIPNRKAVLGISGGLDSTRLLVAVKTMDMMNLPKT